MELQLSKLDRKTVEQLKALFSIRDKTQKVHEVALLVLLQLRGSAKTARDEGMIPME